MNEHSTLGVSEGIQHDAAATGKPRAGSTLTCLDCGSVWEHHELLRIRESHGEVLLYCGVCGSGELEDT